MERRREARIRADKPVELTVLGNEEASGPAQVTEFSGHGLQVVLHRPIPVNSAIKVEGEDWRGASSDATVIEPGTQVTIIQVDGTTLMVEKEL